LPVVPVEPPKPVEKKKEEIKPVPVQTDAPLAVKTEKMKGVTEGYYVVIGVYANPRNAFNERQRLGKRYDVGETIGFVKTTIDFALKSDLKDELVPYLKEKLAELE